MMIGCEMGNVYPVGTVKKLSICYIDAAAAAAAITAYGTAMRQCAD